MKKTDKIKAAAVLCVLMIIMVLGAVIDKKERAYRDFYIEKEITGRIEERSMPDMSGVDINTEDPAELMRLEGIGEKLAERIIEYRQKNGDFEVKEDIMRVDGIGENKFEAIKNDIYTGYETAGNK